MACCSRCLSCGQGRDHLATGRHAVRSLVRRDARKQKRYTRHNDGRAVTLQRHIKRKSVARASNSGARQDIPPQPPCSSILQQITMTTLIYIFIAVTKSVAGEGPKVAHAPPDALLCQRCCAAERQDRAAASSHPSAAATWHPSPSQVVVMEQLPAGARTTNVRCSR